MLGDIRVNTGPNCQQYGSDENGSYPKDPRGIDFKIAFATGWCAPPGKQTLEDWPRARQCELSGSHWLHTGASKPFLRLQEPHIMQFITAWRPAHCSSLRSWMVMRLTKGSSSVASLNSESSASQIKTTRPRLRCRFKSSSKWPSTWTVCWLKVSVSPLDRSKSTS